MTCPRCSGPSRSGLCDECLIEQADEYYRQRAKEATDQAEIDELETDTEEDDE